MRIKSFFLLLLTFSFPVIAQVTDGTKKAFDNAKNDTTRVNILIHMAGEVLGSSPKEAIAYCEQAKTLSEKNNYHRGLSEALGWLAYLYTNDGKLELALTYYKESIPLLEEVNNLKDLNTTYGNMGGIYKEMGKIPEALELYERSLKNAVKAVDKAAEASVCNNMAQLYLDLGEKDKALEFFMKSLNIRLLLKDKDVAESYNNIGWFYEKDHMPDTALKFYLRSFNLYSKLNDKRGIAYTLNNIGGIYLFQGDTVKALEAFYESVKIKEENSMLFGLPFTLNQISTILINQNKIKEAKTLCEKSLKLAKNTNAPDQIANAAFVLKNIYAKEGKYKDALEMFELFKVMKDTVYNQTNRKATYKAQIKYDYDKKEDAIKAEQERDKLIAEEKHKQQRYIIWSVILGLLIVAIFLVIIYQRLQVTKKQKLVIEAQKHEVELQKATVEEQKKEIDDSITYARRIQFALLASDMLLKQNLPDFFVLFKPKNVVSGDFYWATNSNDGFIFVLGDCTGHGVPGAFMSLLNISKLSQTINENKITRPDLILNNVRTEIVSALNPEGSEQVSKDGMDAVLCKLDIKKLKLEFAAANNTLYVLRNNEMIFFKPDKMPVGKGENDERSFSLQSVELQKGDVIYAFTDGYADQFGGPKGKKFKYKQLEDILQGNSQLSMEQQKEKLDNAFENWRGDLEQVDDICVIGIRI